MKKIQKILLLHIFALSNICYFFCFLKEKSTFQRLCELLKDNLLSLFLYIANYWLNCNSKINFLFTEKIIFCYLRQLSDDNFISKEMYNYINSRKNHLIIN